MSATDLTGPVATPAVSRARVFLALLARDAHVTRRELPSFLIRTTLQPILFTAVFGFLLPRMGMVQGFYTASLLPGILAISLSLASLQAVALPMVTDFGFSGEIEDRLLAPVPIELVAHAKMVAGITQGVIAALFVLPLARLIMGPVPGLTLAHAGAVLAVAVLGAAAFSAIGLVLGTAIPPQQIPLMFSAVIGPMMFFGCAYYPWAGLDRVPAMKYAVLVNPLVYVSEGLRGTLTPDMAHMPLRYSLSALALISAGLWALGIRTFVRRAMK
jgi:ABC-2 type transport system permease protein